MILAITASLPNICHHIFRDLHKQRIAFTVFYKAKYNSSAEFDMESAILFTINLYYLVSNKVKQHSFRDVVLTRLYDKAQRSSKPNFSTESAKWVPAIFCI